MVGTTTALLIGAGIAAGGQVASAATASRGANRAAQTQANAARQASSDLRETMAPYLNTGAQAMTTLGSLMGLGGGGTSQPSGGAGTMPLPSAPPVKNNPQVGGAGAAIGYMGNSPYASAGTYPNYAPQSDPARAAMTRQQTSYGGGASSMVQVQAPTGEVRLLPRDQADRFIAMGAKEV